ncbi:MAG: hypothetical protein ACYC8W_07070 [Candidatus Tyrphobacter sp.]
MNTGTFTEQSLFVSAMAAIAGVVYVGHAVRARRYETRPATSCDEGPSWPRYGVAVVAFALAALVLLGIVQPVIGYAVLCLAMVSVFVADLAYEERARRRRIASLSPRPRADLVPASWAILAALSAFMVAPYAVESSARAAAIIIGMCTLVMAAMAWRIAAAPEQLAGRDPRAERILDRASRARRSGLTSALAVGIVFVLASFFNENESRALVTPLEFAINFTSLGVWAGIWAWQALYVRRLTRAAMTIAS